MPHRRRGGRARTAPLDSPQTISGAAKIGYEDAKRLARHDDPAVRTALAQRLDVRPELLYFLAEDTDATVRRAVAENAQAPRQADLMLASDHDDEVRSAIAGKIVRAAPGQDAKTREQARAISVEVLEVLARDQV